MMKSNYGWKSHYALFVLLLVYMVNLIDRHIMGILMEPIKREFDVSDTAMGLLSGLTFAVFYSALAIPFSRYADKENRRNFVAYCCGTWSVMTSICGLATGYWFLAASRAGVAVGEAGGSAPSMSMISDYYPVESRGKAMGIYYLGPSLGSILGLALGGWIAQNYGWRTAFIALGIPGIVLAMIVRFTLVEPVREKNHHAYDEYGDSMKGIMNELMRNKLFKLIMLAGLMMGFAGYGVAMWNPTFLVRTHSMTLQNAGIVMGLLGGVMAGLGALISGWLCDRLSLISSSWRIGVPALGCLLSLPSAVAFYVSPVNDYWYLFGYEIPVAVIYYMFFGVTAVWWTAPVFSEISEIVSSNKRATAISVFNLGLTLIGAGCGPLFIGFMSDELEVYYGLDSLRWVLLFSTVICYGAGLILFMWAMKYSKKK